MSEKAMDPKSKMREGFEAQRKAGMNVDWFTWQIAWHDALFTVHDIGGDSPTAPAQSCGDAEQADEVVTELVVALQDSLIMLDRLKKHCRINDNAGYTQDGRMLTLTSVEEKARTLLCARAKDRK